MPFDDTAGFTAPAAFGPFRVLHQTGSGVLGPVFRTFDPHEEKLVAVKVFRLDVVPEVSARLAGVLKRLAVAPVTHPAVVGILDAGLEGTTAFLATEYVAGETLDVSLRRLAPAPLDLAVPLLRQVAEALQAGWAAGMGHGALHPRDIFVMPVAGESSGTGPVIRVSGFGITDALEELRIPTPVRRPYTAPEREQPGDWDIRADVYSLGVIAYELLAGRRPTGSPDAEQDAQWPADASPDERSAIRLALSVALAADPRERFDTPMALVDALTGPQIHQDAPEAPLLPWPAEPVQEEEEHDPEPEAAPVATFTGLPPITEPARESGRARAGAPPEYFSQIVDRPRQNAMPRIIAVAAITLAVGTAFGYWLRGPAAAPDAVSPPVVTSVPADEPIGTDVAVNDPVQPAPAQTSATAIAPPEAPVADSPSTRGRMLVRSVPTGATVSLNGRASGTTPATIRDLPFGTYTVSVSRSGYQRAEQRVTISKAVPAREITVELPGVAPAAPARRSSVPAATTGSVFVLTRPTGASISIDGRDVGTTPVRVPELLPGSHTVRLTLAGHKPVTTTVVIRAGQQTRLPVSMEIQ